MFSVQIVQLPSLTLEHFYHPPKENVTHYQSTQQPLTCVFSTDLPILNTSYFIQSVAYCFWLCHVLWMISPINLEGEIPQPTCLWLQWYSIQKQPSTQGNWPSPKLLRDRPHHVGPCTTGIKCGGGWTSVHAADAPAQPPWLGVATTKPTLCKRYLKVLFFFLFNFWGKILFFFSFNFHNKIQSYQIPLEKICILYIYFYNITSYIYNIYMQKFEDFIESRTSKRHCTMEWGLLTCYVHIHTILLKRVTSEVTFHVWISKYPCITIL